MTDRVACVGAVVLDERRGLLLVRRANEPGRGLWSIPGGRVEPGETAAAAVVREVREETGLEVTVGRLLGSVVRGRYDIDDFACTAVGGTLVAGDDALEARFVVPDELTALPLTEDLLETLRGWDAL